MEAERRSAVSEESVVHSLVSNMIQGGYSCCTHQLNISLTEKKQTQPPLQVTLQSSSGNPLGREHR